MHSPTATQILIKQSSDISIYSSRGDILQVTVAIPTYKTRNTIFKLLDSLLAQSYSNFDVMIVYKPWDGCKQIFDRVKKYSGLNIRLVRQDAGLFEEALNTIYRKVDADIVIHTDDDAYASRDWVRDHVELHKRHKEVGMATGVVDESRYPDGTPVPFFTRFLNGQKWRMNKHTLIDKPIDARFKDYGMYIGKSGMLVDTGRRYNMIKTFKQHGVNFSYKKDALKNFKLPCYTKQGGRNEAAAALEAIKRGYDVVWFDSGKINHPLQRSDSRSGSIRSIPIELIVESVLFSYYVKSYAGYEVDLEVLRRRTSMDGKIARTMRVERRGYELGYQITRKAIEQRWSPGKVRGNLLKTIANKEVVH